MKKVLMIVLSLLYGISAYSQSVYMHEAQQVAEENGDVSASSIIVFAVFVGFIWLVYRIIKDSVETKKKIHLENEKRRLENENRKNEERIHREIKEFHDSLDCKNFIDVSGYPAVDLGLDSGLLWAKFNVGTDYCGALGDMFVWGNNDTIDRKPIYDIFQTPLQMTDITKDFECWDLDGSYAGEFEYDAASKTRGGLWFTPRIYEIEELIQQCEWQYISKYATKGWKVIGKNGNFIFIPLRTEKLLDEKTPYLTSSPDLDNDKVSVCEVGKFKNAYFLMFNRIDWQDKYNFKIESRGRIRGGFIRPVTYGGPEVYVNEITEMPPTKIN